jgi:hypothetical protein
VRLVVVEGRAVVRVGAEHYRELEHEHAGADAEAGEEGGHGAGQQGEPRANGII